MDKSLTMFYRRGEQNNGTEAEGRHRIKRDSSQFPRSLASSLGLSQQIKVWRFEAGGMKYMV